MGSEQVASVLRQSGSQVRLVVARPIESSAIDIIQVKYFEQFIFKINNFNFSQLKIYINKMFIPILLYI